MQNIAGSDGITHQNTSLEDVEQELGTGTVEIERMMQCNARCF